MRFVLSFLLGLGAVTTGACKSTSGSAEERLETKTIVVEGMTCPVHCPPKVRAALKSVAGVEKVEVDFDHHSAQITCRSGCDPAALFAALERAGFHGASK